MAKVPEKYLQARTDEILIAATECFARKGFRGTSMSHIAAEAGISVGGLYRYFDSKLALFHALTQKSTELNRALWAETEAGAGAADQLHTFVNRYMEMAADPKCRSSLALDIRFRDEALDSRTVRREVEKACLAQLGFVTGLLRSAKGADQDERATQAEGSALVALLAGAGLQILAGVEFDLSSYRKTVLAIVDAWVAGSQRESKAGFRPRKTRT